MEVDRVLVIKAYAKQFGVKLTFTNGSLRFRGDPGAHIILAITVQKWNTVGIRSDDTALLHTPVAMIE